MSDYSRRQLEQEMSVEGHSHELALLLEDTRWAPDRYLDALRDAFRLGFAAGWEAAHDAPTQPPVEP